jgi:MOSC domain-containing protein YiiM
MPVVAAVARDARHRFSKTPCTSIKLIAGLGVAHDAHCGVTVKHRSRVAADPTQPNLRQVHLIHQELHDELAARGMSVAAGDMGENILTRGIDLLGLPRGTKLNIGTDAIVEITGLRNPCVQLDRFMPGLLAAVLDRGPDGSLLRKAGVMGIVIASGDVQPGDTIIVQCPEKPWQKLDRV